MDIKVNNDLHTYKLPITKFENKHYLSVVEDLGPMMLQIDSHFTILKAEVTVGRMLKIVWIFIPLGLISKPEIYEMFKIKRIEAKV